MHFRYNIIILLNIFYLHINMLLRVQKVLSVFVVLKLKHIDVTKALTCLLLMGRKIFHPSFKCNANTLVVIPNAFVL